MMCLQGQNIKHSPMVSSLGGEMPLGNTRNSRTSVRYFKSLKQDSAHYLLNISKLLV